MEYVSKAASSVSAVAASMPQGTGTILACGAVGAAAVPLTAAVAGALVPSAMACFGTVVSGVGTIHAAGGVAATLQFTAATLATTSAAAVGGAVGAAAGTSFEAGRRWIGY